MNWSEITPNTRWTKRVFARVVVCGLLLLVPACHIPNPKPADPGAVLPATFNGIATPDNSAQLRVEEFFNDPVLINLIYQSMVGNQELKILAQDIQIAQNEILLRTGAYFPFVSLRGGAGLGRASAYTPEGAAERQLLTPRDRHFPDPLPDFLIAANVSWQVDIWRKLRNARDAATLRYLATADGRNYVVTRMVADVAENYYTLLALDQRLQTLDETIKIQEQALEMAEARFKAGRGNDLAVQRFLAEVRKNQSERLIVRQEVVETENRINFLLGRFPQRVERPVVPFLDLNLRALSLGVPAQLLQNRPDIRQAEREVAAAGLDVKVARAEFFPQLDITGGIGYRAFNPQYLFNPEALIGNITGDLVAPLVNRTAIKAVYRTASARQLQSVYEYQRTILDAFTEVINRVAMVENYRVSIEFKKQQLAALEASVDNAVKLYQAGRIEYMEVLLAVRDLLDARMVLIDTKRRQLSAIVNAYQALGGGGNLWQLFNQMCGSPGPLGDPRLQPGPGPGPLPQPQQSAPDANTLPLPRPILGPDQAPPPRPVPDPKKPELQPVAAFESAPRDTIEWTRPKVPMGEK